MRNGVVLVLFVLFLLVPFASAALPNSSMTSLMHFNWSPSGTNFTDENGQVWKTFASASHFPYINTTGYKFGNGSMWFYGATDASSLSITSDDKRWWRDNHTIEFWYYPVVTSGTQTLYFQPNGSYGSLHLLYDGTNTRLKIYAGSVATSWNEINGDFSKTGAIPLGQWSHIEVDYNYPSLNIYVNGMMNYTKTLGGRLNKYSSTVNTTIGQASANNVYGGIDEYAEWNLTRNLANFTPPSSEYLDDGIPSGSPITASFTQAPNPSVVDQVVTFTDTSDGTPTTWSWTLEGASPTNTSQNAEYAYSALGTYTVFLNITNSTGHWSNTSQTHTVTNTSGFTEQDLWLAGQYLQTFTITDSGTLAAITNVTIVSSSGKTYVTTNGTGYLTEPFGLYTVTFSRDGYYPRTISYVFDADASHAVALTETGAGATDINLQGTPKDVKFHITSFWGAPIANANVTIQGISTTTGSWDWVATLLSIDLEETPIQNTSMSGLTDTNGDAVFLMLASLKYNVSVSASGYTFPLTYISPQGNQYPISANMNESWFSSGNDTLKEVNVSVSWVTKNATHAFVNITYQDDTGTTTGGNIKVYQKSAGRAVNASPIAVMNVTASSCSNSTVVEVPTGGASYVVDVNATTSTGTNIKRTFAHDFKGQPVNLPGFTPETQLWLAMFILIFTAAFAGVLHAPQMSIVLCVELWAFWAIRWFDHLIDGNGFTEVVLVTMFILATFAAFVWNIAEGKSKGKRSS